MKLPLLHTEITDYDIIGIDPGIGGTGVAKFTGGMPCKYEALSPTQGARWDQLLPDYVAEIEESVYTFFSGNRDNAMVVIEMPMFMGSSSGGTTARSGALVKLSMLAGAIFYACQEYHPHLVTPMRWKGNLSKRIVKERLHERLTRLHAPVPGGRMPSHTWDALGIGLWAYGRF